MDGGVEASAFRLQLAVHGVLSSVQHGRLENAVDDHGKIRRRDLDLDYVHDELVDQARHLGPANRPLIDQLVEGVRLMYDGSTTEAVAMLTKAYRRLERISDAHLPPTERPSTYAAVTGTSSTPHTR